ncbi:MAG: H+-translocating transhydrogenase subunit alpha [Solirubrobacteraceae bacterium]|jgi:NAD(P) transhydrogenase subunit alpha|nr:H+-translocating transhydrogenase subunit alpha [Solirubrobacteraceae bacterium]
MLITNLAILVLAGFVGFSVISKVPNTLHTPLMSGTNAIHGIVVLAGLLVIGFSSNDIFNKVIIVIAVTFGTINVVGGFLVTDRMLGMFKRKPEPPPQVQDTPEPKPPGEPMEAPAPEVDSSEPDPAAAATAPTPATPAADDPAPPHGAGEPGAAAAETDGPDGPPPPDAAPPDAAPPKAAG